MSPFRFQRGRPIARSRCREMLTGTVTGASGSTHTLGVDLNGGAAPLRRRPHLGPSRRGSLLVMAGSAGSYSPPAAVGYVQVTSGRSMRWRRRGNIISGSSSRRGGSIRPTGSWLGGGTGIRSSSLVMFLS